MMKQKNMTLPVSDTTVGSHDFPAIPLNGFPGPDDQQSAAAVTQHIAEAAAKYMKSGHPIILIPPSFYGVRM
jgi:hypothetical protein